MSAITTLAAAEIIELLTDARSRGNGLSYAREEVTGGPLEKGRRKCGATSDGDV